MDSGGDVTTVEVSESRPLRVLHLITSLMTGGAEIMLQKLVRATRSLGYSSTVVSLTGLGAIGRELQDDGIPVVALGGKGGLLLPRHILKLVRTYRGYQPHLLHCWMYHANVLGYGLVRMGGASKRPGLITSVRVALDAHYVEKASTAFVRGLDARLSKSADGLVFNSHRAAEQHALKGYCMRRATVIPNFFDTDQFRPRPEERTRLRKSLGCDDAVLIGVVARFDRQKDQRGFLQAARIVRARFGRCQFLLAGRGCEASNSELMGWIQEYGLADSVHLLGERRDTPLIQAGLDVAVCSSVSEGFPNTVGEAMACGVPCVVTDVGDCRLVVGDAGLVVPPRNPEALASAIVRLVDLPNDERKRLGERARQRVMMEFATGPVVEKFTALYESVRSRGAYAAADR